jgi:hypothetical protein
MAPESSNCDLNAHSYYVSSPESPDGNWVLFFHSTTAEAHAGELRIRHRMTGEVRTLSRICKTEDAHRVACQQWISKGKRVIFHDYRDGKWIVASVEIDSGKETTLATDRLVGWGQPHSDIVPMYGLHWSGSGSNDIQLLDVNTGKVQSSISMETFRSSFAEEIRGDKDFHNENLKLFFPLLSPDLNRVFFKVASPRDGNFQSKKASVRKWLIAYDFKESRFLFRRDSWGHPFWHPDSRHILQIRHLLIDSDTGKDTVLPGLPHFPGSHPSMSPDGQLFSTDVALEPFEKGAMGWWGVAVGDLVGNHQIIHRFDHSMGATSWRIPHPHPSFSSDSRRLYYNVSSSAWTRLHVAERVE